MQTLKILKITIVVLGSFLAPKLHAQLNDSSAYTMNKNTFTINLNYIYNFSSNRHEISNTYLTGTPTNYNGSGIDSVYYEKHKYIGTSSFGFNINYNKKVTKHTSLSLGLGINQKKETTKYSVFNDGNLNKPDLKETTFTRYSLLAPANFNYFYKRLSFSIGNSFYYNFYKKSIKTYQDLSNKKSHYDFSNFDIYMQESISYQLIKKSGLYLRLTLEQTEKFYKNYGYNNWFMIGIAYQC
jgi:hypothetical protein